MMKRRILAMLLAVALACTLLPTAALAADPVEYKVTGGTILFNEATSTITGYTGSPTKVVIPSKIGQTEVKVIGKGAFKNCSSITEVTLFKNIKTIDESAFENCVNLVSVSILAETPLELVGKKAFAFCNELKTFVCAVKKIGQSAFSNCEKLTTVIILDALEEIGDNVFVDCKALKNVFLAGDVIWDKTGDNIFTGDSQITTVHMSGFSSENVRNRILKSTNNAVEHTNALAEYIIQSPDCKKTGYIKASIPCKEADCSFDKIDLKFPASNHSWVSISSDPPNPPNPKDTCETMTVKYHKKCSVCGEEQDIEETIVGEAPHTPKYDPTMTDIKAATCAQLGVKINLKKCDVCSKELLSDEEKKTLAETYLTYLTLMEAKNPTTRDAVDDTQEKIDEALEALKDKGYAEEDSTSGELKPVHIEKIEKTTEHKRNEGDTYTDFIGFVDPDKSNCETGGLATVKFECIVCHEEFVVTNYMIEAGKHVPDQDYSPTDDEIKDAGINPDDIKEPTCTEGGNAVWRCSLCGTIYLEKGAGPLGHSWKKDKTTHAATCTEDGYEFVECERCGEKKDEKVLPAPGHKPKEGSEKEDPDNPPTDPTCTESGLKAYTAQCETCGEDYYIEEVLPALGHDPGDLDESSRVETKAPTCTEEGEETYTSTCKRCDVKTEFSFPIPALGHEYPDEWTPTSDGGKQRTCKREGCGYVQKLNSNGELVDPDDPSDPDTDDEDDPDTLYSVRLSSISNGSVVRSVSSAKAGESVTLTAYANAGYELNTVSVRDADGNPVNLTYDGENRYTFKMPSMRVTVYAEFSKAYSSSPTGSGSGASSSSSQGNNSSSSSGSGIPVNRPTPHAAAAGQIYYDVPSNHWASGEIAWAYQSGFMGGTNAGAFVPDGRITNQQMWLVLARVTGNHPASMAEARQWAIQNAVAEGANPNVSVTRQQMVIALYRCTALLGRSTASHGSLAGYVDSKTVPNAARNAMTWAITNGIISGTADKRLNPSGTITRAQFAVILYRYYRQIM